MDQKGRVRRTTILCCHFLRNAAYYRTGWEDGRLRLGGQFWVTANGNFLDHCVLEWCKLFGDKRGEHYWQKVVIDPAAFWPELLEHLGKSQEQFDSYVGEMRLLRDKFIAHLDSEPTMYPPHLDLAVTSATRLYDHLVTSPETSKFVTDACPSGAKFYGTCIYDAMRVYSSEAD
jgi:hypothetical protein